MPDINIILNIPDDRVNRVATAFLGLENKSINIMGDNGIYSMTFPSKGDDTNKQYIAKNIKLAIKSMIEFYELGADSVRYKAEVENVSKPSASVPDDIIDAS